GLRFTVTQSGVTPSHLIATATSNTSVSLTWTSSSVNRFEVWRNDGGGFVQLPASPSVNAYSDTVSAGAAYVYKVRAVDSNSDMSAFSNSDLATTVFFTDDPITVGATVIKAIHLTELRSAVNIVRAAAGIGAFSFTDTPAAG